MSADEGSAQRVPALSARPESVLLLHGQPGCGALWRPVLDALRDRFELLYPDGFVALAPDRPGWGASPRPACGIADNAQAAFDVLDAHAVERSIVVGHSWGAAVALAMAAERPERISALILLAPAAHHSALVPTDHLLGIPILGTVTSLLGVTAAEGLLRNPAMRRALLPRDGPVANSLELAAPAFNPRRDWRSFAVEQRALLQEIDSIEPELGAIETPTLIIAGGRDRAVRPPAARELADKLQHAELLELASRGHHLPVEAPDTVTAAIVITAGRVRQGDPLTQITLG